MSTLHERLSVLEERTKALPELRADIKETLRTVQATQVRLAQTPTFTDLSTVKERIDNLESARDKASGGWKVLALVSSVIGGVIGGLSTLAIKMVDAAKSLSPMILVAVLLLSSGCGTLLPQRVEFFQDKVKTFPEPSNSEREALRQAAALASERARQTVVAATEHDAPEAVLQPAKDTAALSDSVSTSLGPPKKGYTGPATNLAAKVERDVAIQNARIEKFKTGNDANAGKKIEGTGVFSIGFFSMWVLILGALALVWVGLKVYGMVNPVVGLGTNVVGRVSSTLLRKGVTEIAEGGEWFKEYLSESGLDDKAKELVKGLFSRAQVEAQSRDTQTLISRLTEK